jgi:hypothetical protein
MSSGWILITAAANILAIVWAVRRTLKNRSHLDASAEKLRWAIVMLGIVESLCAFYFLVSGLIGMYLGFGGGLVAGFFIFFPDLANYLQRFFRGSKQASGTPPV